MVMIAEGGRMPRTFRQRLTVSVFASWVPALVVFIPILGLAAAQGGYFPTAWGWATIPLAWVIGLALTLSSEIRLSTPEWIFAALLVAVVGWIALSTVWSVAPAGSVLEAQRALVYAVAVFAVLVVARRSSLSRLLGALLLAIAIISAFSLATRLAPDKVGVYDGSGVYRLAEPIGYWNGLALFASMGVLLALGFASRAESIAVRAGSAALVVLMLPTVYFTFGRAVWIALALGLAAAFVVDPRRLQLLATALVIAGPVVAGVWLSSRKHGLTHAGTPVAEAVHDGHRLALALVGLSVLAGAMSAIFALLGRRVTVGRLGLRAFGGFAALALLVLLSLVFVRYGGPVTLAKKGYAAFKAPPPQEINLNQRLLNFSGNGRADFWRLAWDRSRQHPVLGAGAGTYERYFLAHQPLGSTRVRDAHGLYIETLAELGPFGLALLLAALAVPVYALRVTRGQPLVPVAFGAFATYAVHTGVDWDWELPAVTLAGLFCGAAILVAGREPGLARSLPSPLRWSAVAAAVVAAVFAGIGLVGNSALHSSDSARTHRNWQRAATEARLARSWMPWSPAPWLALGRAQLGAGLLPQARGSLRKAISKDGGDWELWYYLASASSGGARQHALRRAAALIPRANLVSATHRTSDLP
jgi:hypothetical protein